MKKATINGVTRTIGEWGKLLGLDENQKSTVYKRIRRGWPPETAIMTPFQKNTKYIKGKETICWQCLNAVPDVTGSRGCSWSRELIPVKGAVMKTYIRNHNQLVSIIESCPEFIKRGEGV